MHSITIVNKNCRENPRKLLAARAERLHLREELAFTIIVVRGRPPRRPILDERSPVLVLLLLAVLDIVILLRLLEQPERIREDRKAVTRRRANMRERRVGLVIGPRAPPSR